MRELRLDIINEKILILSDIHYPNTNVEILREIVRDERPDILILLGDIIVGGDCNFDSFKSVLQVDGDRTKIVYVKGDEDCVDGDVDVLKILRKGYEVVFLHGHQYFKESAEYSLARFFKKLNSRLPPFLFCLYFRVLFPRADEIILGHSHALMEFRSIRCINAGCLTYTRNLYNDTGYVVMREGKIITVRDNFIDMGGSRGRKTREGG
ncbi:hypothetical protein HS7_17190 [Sulfolobales archaeon HS-7]|nr:hypothetical protein HS7_17190 [Sulfolobales archaeon HS-7]